MNSIFAPVAPTQGKRGAVVIELVAIVKTRANTRTDVSRKDMPPFLSPNLRLRLGPSFQLITRKWTGGGLALLLRR